MSNTTDVRAVVTRANVLLVGPVHWPLIRSASEVVPDALRSSRVERVQRASDAIEWMRGRSLDFVAIDFATVGDETVNLVSALRSAFRFAAVVVVGSFPSAAQVAELFRAGITDWIEQEAWANDGKALCQISAAIERSLMDQVCAHRSATLEGVCRRLTNERKTLQEKLGGACANLADAEESARDREGIAAMQAECRTLLAQESEVEAIVELSTQYLIARVGTTNAAIFLKDHGQYRLAGYVRDDLARRAAGGLIDHVASLWCERIAAHAGIIRFGPNEPPAAQFAEFCGVLPGRSVFAFACPNLDPINGSAVVVLFRDGQRPFSPELEKVARAVGPAFASGLARVRRILTRTQPQWPKESPDVS